jgi:hypothetical protein
MTKGGSDGIRDGTIEVQRIVNEFIVGRVRIDHDHGVSAWTHGKRAIAARHADRLSKGHGGFFTNTFGTSFVVGAGLDDL